MLRIGSKKTFGAPNFGDLFVIGAGGAGNCMRLIARTLELAESTRTIVRESHTKDPGRILAGESLFLALSFWPRASAGAKDSSQQ